MPGVGLCGKGIVAILLRLQYFSSQQKENPCNYLDYKGLQISLVNPEGLEPPTS